MTVEDSRERAASILTPYLAYLTAVQAEHLSVGIAYALMNDSREAYLRGLDDLALGGLRDSYENSVEVNREI